MHWSIHSISGQWPRKRENNCLLTGMQSMRTWLGASLSSLEFAFNTDAAWPSERQGIEYLQLVFLLVGRNCQFGWPHGTNRHNTHAGSLYHWWIGYFILEWEKDDHHDWNLAKCETLEALLLVMFPLSFLQTCSVLWPFWWQGHWQAQP